MENFNCMSDKFRTLLNLIKDEYITERNRYHVILYKSGFFCFLTVLIWVSFTIIVSSTKWGDLFTLSAFYCLPSFFKALNIISKASAIGLIIPFLLFTGVFLKNNTFRPDIIFYVDQQKNLEQSFSSNYSTENDSKNCEFSVDFETSVIEHLKEVLLGNISLNSERADMISRGITFFLIFAPLNIISTVMLIIIQ